MPFRYIVGGRKDKTIEALLFFLAPWDDRPLARSLLFAKVY
jgi:hypothetical protein